MRMQSKSTALLQALDQLISAGTEARGLRKAPTGKEPKLALEQGGRKWVVEGHTDNRDIVLQDVDPKQAVYIFGCSSCTIQVCDRAAAGAAWKLLSLQYEDCPGAHVVCGRSA